MVPLNRLPCAGTQNGKDRDMSSDKKVRGRHVTVSTNEQTANPPPNMEENQQFQMERGIVSVTKYDGEPTYMTTGPQGFCLCVDTIERDGDLSFNVSQMGQHIGTLYLADISEAWKLEDFLEG